MDNQVKIQIIWQKAAAFLIAMAVMALLAVFYRQAFMVTLFLLFVFLPILSAAVTWHAFRMVEVILRPERYLVVRQAASPNRPVTARLSVTSRFPFPILHCELLTYIGHSYYFRAFERVFVLPVYRDRIAISLTVPAGRCGRITTGVKQIRCFDYLGLFALSRALNLQEEIIVMPQSQEPAQALQIQIGEGFDEYDDDGAQGSPTPNVSGVREYREGDRPGSIHWKVSARMRALMTREYERTSHDRIYLLTELYLPDSSQETVIGSRFPFHLYETSEELDRAITGGYTAALSLIEENISFFWGYYHTDREDFISVWITNLEELDMAIREMYYAPVYHHKNLGRDIYVKAGLTLGGADTGQPPGPMERVAYGRHRR